MTRISLILLTAALLVAAPSAGAPSVSSTVVLGEAYGGGGNAGAPYTHDFVELENVSASSVSLDGWSIQYASAAGTSWSVTALPSATLAPGQHFLVQLAGGGAGSPLPTPDATGTAAMGASAGKVALVSSTTPLSGACPSGGTLVDLAGYGSSANCFEGTGPAPAPGNTTSVSRLDAGRRDTDDNATDFAAGPPNPQNSSSPTVATLASFSARPTSNGGAILAWRTATEVGLVGFHVYLRSGSSSSRLTPYLIPATGAPSGHRYSFRVVAIRPGARYGLEEVRLDGTRTWLGWVRLRRS